MIKAAPVRTRTAEAPNNDSAPLRAHLLDLEQQLERLKAQVRQAQQLASLGTAAATIAHEVNNLLTPILGYAKYAIEANEPDLSRKALTITVRNVQMLVGMSERVLGITAAKPTEIRAVGVRRAALDAADSLCRDPAKDGIRFTVEVDDCLRVQADPLQLQQVFFNLFLNARSAMADGHNGSLTVSARSTGAKVHIEIRDTGRGIPPQLLPHIFDPLQSSKSPSPDGPQRCSGLGLALCRDLVQENGGTITASSTVGQGTTFHITLPGIAMPGNA